MGFTLAVSNDSINFEPVQDNIGNQIVYFGNMDRNTIARNFFPKVFVAQYVRFYPVQWSPNGVALRLNFIGCNVIDKPTVRPTVPFFPTNSFSNPEQPSTTTTYSTKKSSTSTGL